MTRTYVDLTMTISQFHEEAWKYNHVELAVVLRRRSLGLSATVTMILQWGRRLVLLAWQLCTCFGGMVAQDAVGSGAHDIGHGDNMVCSWVDGSR